MQQRWESVMQNNYGTPSLAIARGEGCYLYGVNGERYLDLIGGIATNVVGHAHPKVVNAISKQAATFGHLSNLYIHEPGLKLAEKLIQLTGDDRATVFFANSGAEVNEAAFKLARLTGKSEMIATIGGFHGRTLGALSLTGQSGKRDPFKPLIKKIDFIPFNDLTALENAITPETAAFMVEPIQGENGVVVPDQHYLAKVREITKAHGVLMIVDAVQTGMGRTGTFFGYESAGIKPDILTIAKGLGGGLPLGAMISFSTVKNNFTPGSHGSTFGGNPIAAAAALETIAIIEKEELMSWSLKIEQQIKSGLMNIPKISQIRGQGALLAIGFTEPIAAQVKANLQEDGYLVGFSNDYLIRIAPPLTIKNRQIEKFLKTLGQTLNNLGVKHG
jgi:acetylornithine aminotransferase